MNVPAALRRWKSGGVDVHAVKSYSSSCQTEEHSSVHPPAPSPAVHRDESSLGTAHAASSSATQSSDTHSVSTVTQSASGRAKSISPGSQSAPSAASQAAGAGQPAEKAHAAPVGGVLGARAVIAKPRSGHAGVLGTVVGSTLPFTGFPVWIAMLLAFALIGAGLVLRQGASARI